LAFEQQSQRTNKKVGPSELVGIPAHRVFEVEWKELIDEFDMYTRLNGVYVWPSAPRKVEI
jgi:hypothetical protein